MACRISKAKLTIEYDALVHLNLTQPRVQSHRLEIKVNQHIWLLRDGRCSCTNRSESVPPANYSRDEHQQVRVYLCKGLVSIPDLTENTSKKTRTIRRRCGAAKIRAGALPLCIASSGTRLASDVHMQNKTHRVFEKAIFQ